MVELPEKNLPRLGKAITLGVMVDWVGDPYQMGILSGVSDAIAGAGANLLCFVGGALPADPASDARHRIFDLIGRHNVDGVVVLATTLMHQIGQAGIESYCRERLSNLPYCSIGAELKGIPSVAANNERGVRQSVAHLVQVHGHNRIALVRGPLGNEEADRRHEAYAAGLRAHGLTFDEHLVVVGNFMEMSGREAVRQLSQSCGPGLDNLNAIVASNDGMALGVLNGLAERGIAVPRTIAVTGFDDVEEARLTASPLTTVRQPLDKIGRQAARNVLHWMNTGSQPESSEIDTELVIRRSCGCTGSVGGARQSVAPELNYSFESSLIIRRQHILDTLVRAGRGSLGAVGADWQAKLLNAFAADMRGESLGAFSLYVEECGQKLLASGTDVEVCHEVIDVLRRQLTITLRGEPIRRDRAEEMFYSAHVALSDITQRNLNREKFRLGRWVRDMSYVCNRISSSFDLAKLREIVRDHLPRVGLKNFYAVTYPEDRGTGAAEFLVGMDRGREIILPSDGEFKASALLPGHLMESLGTGRAFAVLPLYWNHLGLGHILIELDLYHSFSYGPIAEAIGCGLYGARIAARRC